MQKFSVFVVTLNSCESSYLRASGRQLTNKDVKALIEPPSKELVQRLRALRLCTPADLRMCRGRVKRLSHDLPAFDSVWIDALVQLRKLTPFQGRVLDSDAADELQVGPCVLVDELSRARSSATYLARHIDRRLLCVLKLITPPPESATSGLARLQTLAEELRKLAHPSVEAPKTCLPLGERLVAVSRYVPGADLQQLLVRRGRFSADVVLEIGRQLLDGLSALEEAGYVHGEIRLSKVRLTAAGTAVLVDTGITASIRPVMTIHDRPALERCDSLAPELVGTGREATVASDLYSLGCILWQLLTGRPPFPTGDPLAKLAAHQVKTIPDVRELAPNTPAALAEAIRSLTTREPERRPQHFREVAEPFGPPRPAGRSKLKRFKAAFNTSLPRSNGPARSRSRSALPTMAAALFLLTGLSLTLFDEGARNWLLELTGTSPPVDTPDARTQETPQVANAPRSNLLPFPGTDANGVVTLPEAGPYEAVEINSVGPLVIRSTHPDGSQIVIQNQPLRLSATEVALENIRFRSGAATHGEPVAMQAPTRSMVDVRAQALHIEGCRFSVGRIAAQEQNGRSAPAAVAWSTIDPADLRGGTCEVSNSLFVGAATVIDCRLTPRTFHCRNSLCVKTGPLLAIDEQRGQSHETSFELDGVTLRESSALVQWQRTDESRPGAKAVISARDCVFDLHGSQAALLHFWFPGTKAQEIASVEFDGAGSLTTPQLVVARAFALPDGGELPVDDDRLLVEGLTSGTFQFAGPADDDPQNSVLSSYEGTPRLSMRDPGIDVAKLNRPAGPR